MVDGKVSKLPVANDREHTEAERSRSRRQAVETIGQRFTAFDVAMMTKAARKNHPAGTSDSIRAGRGG